MRKASIKLIAYALTCAEKHYVDLNTYECVCKYNENFDLNKNSYIELPDVNLKDIQLSFIKEQKYVFLKHLLKEADDELFNTKFFRAVEGSDLINEWYAYEENVLREFSVEWCVLNDIEFTLFDELDKNKK